MDSPRSPNATPATPTPPYNSPLKSSAHPSPLLDSAHPSTSPSSPLKATSSLAPEVQQPSTDPEVVTEDQHPKYLVMDDQNNPRQLPKKDFYAPGNYPPGYEPPTGPSQAEKEVDDRRRRGRICGMKKRTFWIVLIVAIVVIAGAVGGGVGGALAGKSNSSAATSSTTSSSATPIGTQIPITSAKTSSTSTSTSSSASATATSFSNGCPGTDQTVVTPKIVSNNSQPVTVWGETLAYTILCATNYGSKTSGYNPQITELQRFQNVSTIDDCITKCAEYNFQLPNYVSDPNNSDFGVLCSNAVFGIYNKLTSSTCFLQAGNFSNITLISFSTDAELTTAALDWPGVTIP